MEIQKEYIIKVNDTSFAELTVYTTSKNNEATRFKNKDTALGVMKMCKEKGYSDVKLMTIETKLIEEGEE